MKQDCPLCHDQHETLMLHGIEMIPCPMVPENLIIPRSTIDAFFQGKSMTDESFLVLAE